MAETAQGTVLTQEPELKLPHSEQQMRQPVGTQGVAAAEAIDWGSKLQLADQLRGAMEQLSGG